MHGVRPSSPPPAPVAMVGCLGGYLTLLPWCGVLGWGAGCGSCLNSSGTVCVPECQAILLSKGGGRSWLRGVARKVCRRFDDDVWHRWLLLCGASACSPIITRLWLYTNACRHSTSTRAHKRATQALRSSSSPRRHQGAACTYVLWWCLVWLAAHCSRACCCPGTLPERLASARQPRQGHEHRGSGCSRATPPLLPEQHTCLSPLKPATTSGCSRQAGGGTLPGRQ